MSVFYCIDKFVEIVAVIVFLGRHGYLDLCVVVGVKLELIL